MPSPFRGILERLRPRQYGRKQPLVLINGLAEQAESWYRNRKYWTRFFDVYTPNILAFEGEALHRKIAARQQISVEYLVQQLHTFLDEFVQTRGERGAIGIGEVEALGKPFEQGVEREWGFGQYRQDLRRRAGEQVRGARGAVQHRGEGVELGGQQRLGGRSAIAQGLSRAASATRRNR